MLCRGKWLTLPVRSWRFYMQYGRIVLQLCVKLPKHATRHMISRSTHQCKSFLIVCMPNGTFIATRLFGLTDIARRSIKSI